MVPLCKFILLCLCACNISAAPQSIHKIIKRNGANYNEPSLDFLPPFLPGAEPSNTAIKSSSFGKFQGFDRNTKFGQLQGAVPVGTRKTLNGSRYHRDDIVSPGISNARPNKTTSRVSNETAARQENNSTLNQSNASTEDVKVNTYDIGDMKDPTVQFLNTVSANIPDASNDKLIDNHSNVSKVDVDAQKENNTLNGAGTNNAKVNTFDVSIDLEDRTEKVLSDISAVTEEVTGKADDVDKEEKNSTLSQSNAGTNGAKINTFDISIDLEDRTEVPVTTDDVISKTDDRGGVTAEGESNVILSQSIAGTKNIKLNTFDTSIDLEDPATQIPIQVSADVSGATQNVIGDTGNVNTGDIVVQLGQTTDESPINENHAGTTASTEDDVPLVVNEAATNISVTSATTEVVKTGQPIKESEINIEFTTHRNTASKYAISESSIIENALAVQSNPGNESDFDDGLIEDVQGSNLQDAAGARNVYTSNDKYSNIPAIASPTLVGLVANKQPATVDLHGIKPNQIETTSPTKTLECCGIQSPPEKPLLNKPNSSSRTTDTAMTGAVPVGTRKTLNGSRYRRDDIDSPEISNAIPNKTTSQVSNKLPDISNETAAREESSSTLNQSNASTEDVKVNAYDISIDLEDSTVQFLNTVSADIPDALNDKLIDNPSNVSEVDVDAQKENNTLNDAGANNEKVNTFDISIDLEDRTEKVLSDISAVTEEVTGKTDVVDKEEKNRTLSQSNAGTNGAKINTFDISIDLEDRTEVPVATDDVISNTDNKEGITVEGESNVTLSQSISGTKNVKLNTFDISIDLEQPATQIPIQLSADVSGATQNVIGDTGNVKTGDIVVQLGQTTDESPVNENHAGTTASTEDDVPLVVNEATTNISVTSATTEAEKTVQPIEESAINTESSTQRNTASKYAISESSVIENAPAVQTNSGNETDFDDGAIEDVQGGNLRDVAAACNEDTSNDKYSNIPAIPSPTLVGPVASNQPATVALHGIKPDQIETTTPTSSLECCGIQSRLGIPWFNKPRSASRTTHDIVRAVDVSQARSKSYGFDSGLLNFGFSKSHSNAQAAAQGGGGSVGSSAGSGAAAGKLVEAKTSAEAGSQTNLGGSSQSSSKSDAGSFDFGLGPLSFNAAGSQSNAQSSSVGADGSKSQSFGGSQAGGIGVGLGNFKLGALVTNNYAPRSGKVFDTFTVDGLKLYPGLEAKYI